MLRAIGAAKKKSDRIDASKICDCLRRDFLPQCYMAPTAIRERRRILLSEPAGAADAADEKQDQFAVDGSRHELQQATATQGRLLP